MPAAPRKPVKKAAAPRRRNPAKGPVEGLPLSNVRVGDDPDWPTPPDGTRTTPSVGTVYVDVKPRYPEGGLVDPATPLDPKRPVERKVKFSAAAAYLATAAGLGVLQAVQGNVNLVSGLPDAVEPLVLALVPGLITFCTGYQTKHKGA